MAQPSIRISYNACIPSLFDTGARFDELMNANEWMNTNEWLNHLSESATMPVYLVYLIRVLDLMVQDDLPSILYISMHKAGRILVCKDMMTPHGYVAHVLKILDMDISCVFGSGTIHYCLHYFLVCTTFVLIAKDFVYPQKVHSLEEDWES